MKNFSDDAAFDKGSADLKAFSSNSLIRSFMSQAMDYFKKSNRAYEDCIKVILLPGNDGEQALMTFMRVVLNLRNLIVNL